MRLYAGIDGGQSSTVALVADEHRSILGRGVAGPCDHIGQSAASARFAQAIESAIGAALQQASLPADSPFEAVVAGISGYEGAIHGLAPKLNAQHVAYLHDARIAHAGAFELGDGIVVIAGTGSVAYGRDAAGNEVTVGGWGYLFGDWGSAFGIAAQELRALMRADDRGAGDEPTIRALTRALRFFERSSLREIARAFYTGEIDRAGLAAFAAEILAAAEQGDRAARAMPSAMAFALADLAEACAKRLGVADSAVPIALAGGTFASAWYREQTNAAIRKLLPKAQVIAPRHDPATGALLLAYKEDR